MEMKRFKILKRLAFVSMVLLAMTIVLGGCGNKEKEGESVIRFGGPAAWFETLDPAKDWNGWYTVRTGLGETLFKLDDSLIPQPWLAEGYETKDGKSYTIKLKEKASFSNGEKVTGEKVVESLKRSGEMNARAAALKDAKYTVEGNSIKIDFDKPYTSLINDLCDPYATIIDVKGSKDLNTPIGTGPFVVEKFEKGKVLELVKNKDYWNGEVKADKIVYTYIADLDTLTLAAKNGEIDIALDLDKNAADALKELDSFNVTNTPQSRVYQLYFNLKTISDNKVREAVSYAIDRQKLVEKKLKGSVIESKGAFPENTPYNGKNLKLRGFDTEKAKALLKEAGYEDRDGDGILEKGGKPLKLKLSVYKRLAIENIATELQADLKKVGIDAEIAGHEKSTFFGAGDFDLGIYSIVTMPTGDPKPFLSSCMTKDGVANFGGYSNEKVDSLLSKLATAIKEDEKVKLVEEIQQQAIDDSAFDYLGFNGVYTGVSKNVKGYTTSPTDYYQVNQNLEKVN